MKSNKPKIHSGHIEIAVAELIGWRQHVIVPNVSWGLGLSHECDLLILDDKSRFTEIEIKISKHDLKRDFDKIHGHTSALITRLVYALPAELIEHAKAIIPEPCGIIAVKYNEGRRKFEAEWTRRCRHRKRMKEIPEHTIRKFLELGCMRIWSLKQTLQRRQLLNIKTNSFNETGHEMDTANV